MPPRDKMYYLQTLKNENDFLNLIRFGVKVTVIVPRHNLRVYRSFRGQRSCILNRKSIWLYLRKKQTNGIFDVWSIFDRNCLKRKQKNKRSVSFVVGESSLSFVGLFLYRNTCVCIMVTRFRRKVGQLAPIGTDPGHFKKPKCTEV